MEFETAIENTCPGVQTEKCKVGSIAYSAPAGGDYHLSYPNLSNYLKTMLMQRWTYNE